uniref:Ribonuclease E/G-like protein n=1 Tax=Vertebrata lanosa TaxID=1261582 RepID=A0A0B5W5Z3_9FLOR|nr:ribonuclease E/G-like protein [Vertebrata lanosa]AJH66036.1 ribonuclease E/G-like protein [Vertebrata lanosa]
MVKKIIISYFNNLAVTLQGNKVQQIILVNKIYQLNDIYIGKVNKIFSSINAAFINLGQNRRSGFIHMSDLKSVKRDMQSFRISDVLSVNQILLVQVIKEPTFSKGPRLTANIHLHGKYIVLMPFCNLIFISSNIYDSNERLHLYSLAILIKPKSMGILIKSAASEVYESLILQDLNLLIQQWSFLQKKFILTNLPSILYKDEDLVKKIVRDFYEKNISKIIVDSRLFLDLIYYYLKKWSYITPSITTKLYLYDKQLCLLDKFYVKRTIRNALKSKVNLWHGGYLFIQSYEALTVIDVNSGSFNKLNSSKDTILRTNLYAAVEIAYQLRLRNINGVIVIDFIDMSSHRDKIKLLENFNKLLSSDDCCPQVVQLSELGLLELTRRRKNQSLREAFQISSAKYLGNFKQFSELEVQSKSFFSIPNYSFNNQSYVNKNIRYLFFNKYFNRNRLLKNKFFVVPHSFLDKYFYFFNEVFPLRFFHPKANYVVPLHFYVQCTKY